MPVASLAIPAGIKLGTSIIGGIQSRGAVNDAVSALLNSFTQAGTTATDAVSKVNPQILDAASTWGDKVMGAGADAADAATAAANKGIDQISGSVKDAQGALVPWTSAGTGALDTLMRMLQKPDSFQFQADPGYQFRLNEGMKAISRQAAAHGAAGGGGTAKAAAQYSSGLASQEYGNAWNRWNTGNQQRQGGLATIAGMGERAGEFSGDLGLRGATASAGLGERAAEFGGQMKTGTTQWAGGQNIAAVDKTSQNSLDLANFLANLQINSGKATAGGNISKGNIWNSTINGVGSGLLDFITGYGKQQKWKGF